jgi:hypothetical protein
MTTYSIPIRFHNALPVCHVLNVQNNWFVPKSVEVGIAIGMSNPGNFMKKPIEKKQVVMVDVPNDAVSSIYWWNRSAGASAVRFMFRLGDAITGIRNHARKDIKDHVHRVLNENNGNCSAFELLLNKHKMDYIESHPLTEDSRHIELNLIELVKNPIVSHPDITSHIATQQTHENQLDTIQQQLDVGIQRWRSHDTYCNLANPFVILPEVDNIPTDHHKLAYDLMSIGSYITSDIATKPGVVHSHACGKEILCFIHNSDKSIFVYQNGLAASLDRRDVYAEMKILASVIQKEYKEQIELERISQSPVVRLELQKSQFQMNKEQTEFNTRNQLELEKEQLNILKEKLAYDKQNQLDMEKKQLDLQILKRTEDMRVRSNEYQQEVDHLNRLNGLKLKFIQDSISVKRCHRKDSNAGGDANENSPSTTTDPPSSSGAADVLLSSEQLIKSMGQQTKMIGYTALPVVIHRLLYKNNTHLEEDTTLFLRAYNLSRKTRTLPKSNDLARCQVRQLVNSLLLSPKQRVTDPTGTNITKSTTVTMVSDTDIAFIDQLRLFVQSATTTSSTFADVRATHGNDDSVVSVDDLPLTANNTDPTNVHHQMVVHSSSTLPPTRQLSYTTGNQQLTLSANCGILPPSITNATGCGKLSNQQAFKAVASQKCVRYSPCI